MKILLDAMGGDNAPKTRRLGIADSGMTPSNCRRAATIRQASSTSGTRGSGAFADISR